MSDCDELPKTDGTSEVAVGMTETVTEEEEEEEWVVGLGSATTGSEVAFR